LSIYLKKDIGISSHDWGLSKNLAVQEFFERGFSDREKLITVSRKILNIGVSV